jgi:hypothetical protein
MRLAQTALLAVWLSVLLTTWGACLRNSAPQFKLWEAEQIRKWEAAKDGRDVNNFGLLMSMTPGFELQLNSLTATVFTVGLFTSRLCATRGPKPFRLIPVVFGIGCVAGVVVGMKSGVDDCRWSFFVLGSGYLLASGGLACGVVSTWKSRNMVATP